MIEKLIKEIEICLKNELYMSALTISLILPDICGKAEYPQENKNNVRYKNWLENYVKFDKKVLSVKDLYKLRNNILHQGTPTTKNKENIEEFELIISPLESARMTMWSTYSIHNEKSVKKIVSVNLLYICKMICEAAINYHKTNKEKFNFINYNIVPAAKMTRNIFGI